MRIVLLAGLLAATPALATSYTLDLTGQLANLTTGTSYYAPLKQSFQTGTLALSGFTPFTVSQGDDVTVNITLDGALSVPAANDQTFLFAGLDEGDGETVTGTSGNFTFANPVGIAGTVGTNCSCLSPAYFQPGVQNGFSFTGLTSAFHIDGLTQPYTVSSASLFYQVDSIPAGGVPEPAAWALLLTGFGTVGLAARRRAGRMLTAVGA